MRAILDEQLSPQIAVLLRQAGYDVDAVVDREDLVSAATGSFWRSHVAKAGRWSRTTSKTSVRLRLSGWRKAGCMPT